MGFRQKLSQKRDHYKKLGVDGIKLVKESKSKKEGELISIKIKDYSNTIHLRSKTSDIPTFYQCIYDKEYDINLDFTPKTIVDLGANIGLTTVFFKNKYPNVKIISVEPEDSNFLILKKNTEHFSDVTIIKSGIWNKSAHLLIEDNGHGHYGFTVKECSAENDKAIKALSIDEIMDNNNLKSIDILKIDIEGSEKELFETNFENWLPKVKVLIIELHDRMKDGCSKSFFKALVNYNFEFSMKGENVVCYMKH